MFHAQYIVGAAEEELIQSYMECYLKKKTENTAKDTKTLLCEILATSKYMLSSESVLCYVTIQ